MIRCHAVKVRYVIHTLPTLLFISPFPFLFTWLGLFFLPSFTHSFIQLQYRSSLFYACIFCFFSHFVSFFLVCPFISSLFYFYFTLSLFLFFSSSYYIYTHIYIHYIFYSFLISYFLLLQYLYFLYLCLDILIPYTFLLFSAPCFMFTNSAKRLVPTEISPSLV